MSTTKERPILFSGPMVRALLAGTKTQTRRIVKARDLEWMDVHQGLREPDNAERCPYGQSGDRLLCSGHRIGGDRLYVREAWAAPHAYDHLPPRLIPQDARIHYAATEDRGGLLWRPSIHMPRWASRITLEVTGVLVERLQEISYEDARAEGVEFWRNDGTLTELPPCSEHRYAFEDLWTSINGADSWNANPFVWVVSFRRLDAKEAKG